MQRPQLTTVIHVIDVNGEAKLDNPVLPIGIIDESTLSFTAYPSYMEAGKEKLRIRGLPIPEDEDHNFDKNQPKVFEFTCDHVVISQDTFLQSFERITGEHMDRRQKLCIILQGPQQICVDSLFMVDGIFERCLQLYESGEWDTVQFSAVRFSGKVGSVQMQVYDMLDNNNQELADVNARHWEPNANALIEVARNSYSHHTHAKTGFGCVIHQMIFTRGMDEPWELLIVHLEEDSNWTRGLGQLGIWRCMASKAEARFGFPVGQGYTFSRDTLLIKCMEELGCFERVLLLTLANNSLIDSWRAFNDIKFSFDLRSALNP